MEGHKLASVGPPLDWWMLPPDPRTKQISIIGKIEYKARLETRKIDGLTNKAGIP